ncbi:hypothetical protein Aperf_G00000085834 [Anoplocephala perfoliata]
MLLLIKSHQESLDEPLKTEVESSKNEPPKETMDVDTGSASRYVDSGIGTASGSNIETNLCSTQKTPLQKESFLKAAISTPLNDRDPARVSEIIQTPGPSTKGVQGPSEERRRRREKKFHYCTVCNKKFDRPSLLKRHSYTHTKEKPWKCKYCNKGFNTKSLVTTHERIHTGEKPFRCEFCGKRFNAGSNFSFHRDIHLKKRRHQCEVCKKRFVTPGDLRKHSYTHTGNWPFRCQQCNKGYATERSLRNHEPVHSQVKPFPCTLCNRSYTTESSLKSHMRQHQGKFLLNTHLLFCESEIPSVAPPQQKSCPASPSQEFSGNPVTCSERPQSTTNTSNSNNRAPPLVSQSPWTSAQPAGTELTQNRPLTRLQTQFGSPEMNPATSNLLTSFKPSTNPQRHQTPMDSEGHCNPPGLNDRPPSFRQPLAVLHDADPQIRSLKNQFEGLGLKVSSKSAFTVMAGNRKIRPNLLESQRDPLWNITQMGPQPSRQYRPSPWPQPPEPEPDDLPLDLSTKEKHPRS